MSKATNAPWRDEGILRQKYWVEGKSLTEVGDELGCSRSTIRKWLNRYELGTRAQAGDPDADYRDPEILKHLYWQEGLSTIKIAERLDCSKETVQKWMGRHGIKTRASYHDKNGCFFTDQNGYEYFAITQNYETTSVSIHRLLAIAMGVVDPENVRDKTTNIHHKNGIPWDNRPENIEVLSVAEHARLHERDRKRNESGDFV